MSRAPALYWLPEPPDFAAALAALAAAPDWAAAVALARTRLDFLRTNALDRLCARALGPPPAGAPRLRLAILGSAGTPHLHAGIRMAGLRRGLHVAVHEGAHGQYRQDLVDPPADLRDFAPEAVLLVMDTPHLVSLGMSAGGSLDGAAEQAVAELVGCWRTARAAFGCTVLQQTALPLLPPLLGQQEHRGATPAAVIARINATLRAAASAEDVLLVSLDTAAARDGLDAWHNPALWLQARQEVTPAAAPAYGEAVGRLLGALRGRSAKALVLDLDDTLWGGAIGEAGIEGIVLGPGSAEGEAFAAVQSHARALAARGVILAVCSKNDAAVAEAAFARHPRMVLRPSDIACFVANWEPKSVNLRRIAATLGIGLDALVLLDNAGFERAEVRAALPDVHVPELPEEPALYPRVLADAGYFEAVGLTAEDAARTERYQVRRVQAAVAAASPDLHTYLAGLDMRLHWQLVTQAGLTRAAQLINKTNQFNLTGARITEAALAARLADRRCLALQFRLVDRLEDSGVIAVVLGQGEPGGALLIDTWLMSCRVLGRQVEQACAWVLADSAARLGWTALHGLYTPTGRNGMVDGLYARLGFAPAACAGGVPDEAACCYHLALPAALPAPPAIRIEETSTDA